MSELTRDRSLSRRRFLKFAATAAGTAATLPALAACSPQASAPSKPADAKPTDTKPAAPAAPAAQSTAAPTAARVVPGQAGAAQPAAAKVGAMAFMQENSFIKGFDEHFTKVLAPRYKEETGIELSFDGVSVGGLQAKITASVETNSGPDATMMSFNWPHLYAQKLLDVTDIAEDMGRRGGGWLDNIKEAVVVDGKWRAIPLGNVGQLMVYRMSWFKDVGFDRFPDTWDELLEAGTKLKEKGRPMGFEYGYGFGDNHGWMYPLLWSYGGREVDADGKTVVLDSAETARSVDYARTLFERTMLPDVLGWTDVNNNRSFLAEQVSCTNNASSILQVAKNEFPALVDDIGHAPNPKGPTGERFALLNSWSFGALSYSPNPEAAKDLIRWLSDDKQYIGWLAAADAYYQPFLKSLDTHPMWQSDARMAPFKESLPTTHLPGWPAAGDRRASESLSKYVIVNMYLGAAQGKSTSEVVSTATSQLKQIYGVS